MAVAKQPLLVCTAELLVRRLEQTPIYMRMAKDPLEQIQLCRGWNVARKGRTAERWSEWGGDGAGRKWIRPGRGWAWQHMPNLDPLPGADTASQVNVNKNQASIG